MATAENKNFFADSSEKIISGQVNFEHLSRQEQEGSVFWYEENFKLLKEEEKQEFLEQLIQNGLLSDEKAYFYVEQMPENSKKAIGEFLFRLGSPEKYVQTFYECFHYLSLDLQDEIISYYTNSFPEKAHLVAPFANLSIVPPQKEAKNKKNENAEEKIDEGGYSKTPKTILQEYCSKFDRFQLLLDNLVLYCERYNDFSAKRKLAVILQDSASLAQRGYYAKQALSLGVVNQKDLVFDFNPDDFFIQNTQPFLTENETAEKLLRKEKIRVRSGKEKDEVIDLYDPTALHPKAEVLGLAALEDKAQKRALEGYLMLYESCKGVLPQRREYFSYLFYNSLPVLSSSSRLGFSKKELLGLLKREVSFDHSILTSYFNEDLSAVLNFNRQNSEEADCDLEDFLSLYIIKRIEELGDNDIRLCEVVFYDPQKFFSLWGEGSRKKIINAINKNAPDMWLYNPSFAFYTESISPTDLLNSAEPEKLINFYWSLQHALHKYGKYENGKVVELVLLKEKLKKAILENPSLLVEQKSGQVISQVLTAEEIKNIYSENFQIPVDVKFIFNLVNSGNYKNFKQEITILLRSDENLLINFANRISGFEELRLFLNFSEIAEFVIKNIDQLDHKLVFKEEAFTAKFCLNESLMERLIDKCVENSLWEVWTEIFWQLKVYSEKTVKLLEKPKLKAKLVRLLKNREKGLDTWEIKDIRKRLQEMPKTDFLGEYSPQEACNIFETKNKEIKNLLYTMCVNNPSLVFESKIQSILGEEIYPIIQANIQAAAKSNPEILLKTQYFGGKDILLYKKVLGEERFMQLVTLHKYKLALTMDQYGDRLYERGKFSEVADLMKSINYIEEIDSVKELSEDYFVCLLERLAQSPFYSLYKGALEAYAQDQMETMGPQLRPSQVQKSGDFLKMVNTIVTLDNSAIAVRYASEILSLPKKEQEKVITILSAEVRGDLEEYSFSSNSDLSFSEELNRLESAFKLYVENTFELPVKIDYAASNFDFASLYAALTYYKTVCKDDPKMKKVFLACVDSSFAGGYEHWKMWGKNDIKEGEKDLLLQELKDEKLLPGNLSLPQYEKWCSKEESNFETVIGFNPSELSDSLHEIIQQSVADGHVTLEAITSEKDEESRETEILAMHLDQMLNRKKELENKFNRIKQARKKGDAEITEVFSDTERQEFDSLGKEIRKFSQENQYKLDKSKAVKYLRQIQNLSASDLESLTIGDFKEKGSQVALTKVFATLRRVYGVGFPEFINDLERIQSAILQTHANMFSGQRISKSKLNFTDKVDLPTYILIGEKPVASCQHYASTAGMNEGLLSYMADPAVKIIQMYNEEGSIVARAIMRLMSDKLGNPVLYVERVYTNSPHSKITEAVNNFAVQKANSMGIPVTGKLFLQKQKSFSGRLFSWGSRSKYIYTDDGGGKIFKGIFVIKT